MVQILPEGDRSVAQNPGRVSVSRRSCDATTKPAVLGHPRPELHTPNTGATRFPDTHPKVHQASNRVASPAARCSGGGYTLRRPEIVRMRNEMTARTNSTTPTQSRKLRDCTKPPVIKSTTAIMATITNRIFICSLPRLRPISAHHTPRRRATKGADHLIPIAASPELLTCFVGARLSRFPQFPAWSAARTADRGRAEGVGVLLQFWI